MLRQWRSYVGAKLGHGPPWLFAKYDWTPLHPRPAHQHAMSYPLPCLLRRKSYTPSYESTCLHILSTEIDTRNSHGCGWGGASLGLTILARKQGEIDGLWNRYRTQEAAVLRYLVSNLIARTTAYWICSLLQTATAMWKFTQRKIDFVLKRKEDDISEVELDWNIKNRTVTITKDFRVQTDSGLIF
jgi:hypothetical protein